MTTKCRAASAARSSFAGTNVMKGYYKRPEATAEAFRNGWFHTGDIGIMDDEGYLAIVDRKKDMILRGGYNIYPRELEEVIITHPAVSLCAVIGVPCERLGEEVKAFVVLKNRGTNLRPKNLSNGAAAVCRQQISAARRVSCRTADRRHGKDIQAGVEGRE